MEAALALRGRDADARITLVSEEHDHFFSRPALMYVFAGQLRLQDTEPYDRGLYERMGFERVRAPRDGPGRGRPGAGAGGRAPPGLRPAAAGGGLAGAARALAGRDGPRPPLLRHPARPRGPRRSRRRPGQRAVVVGGGLIGVEVAEVLRHRGLDVDLRGPRELVLPAGPGRSARPRLGRRAPAPARLSTCAWARTWRRSSAGPAAPCRACASPRGGVLPGDLVVSAIGVVPNTGFLAGSEVARWPRAARSRSTRACARSVDGVWAAGDCANVTWADGTRAAGAALVHRARPGTRGGRVHARRRGRLPPRHLVQLRQVLRPRVHHRRLGARPAQLGQHAHRPRPGRAAPGSSACRDGRRASASSAAASAWSASTCWAAAGTTSCCCSGSTSGESLEWVLARLGQAQFDEELTPRWRRLV